MTKKNNQRSKKQKYRYPTQPLLTTFEKFVNPSQVIRNEIDLRNYQYTADNIAAQDRAKATIKKRMESLELNSDMAKIKYLQEMLNASKSKNSFIRNISRAVEAAQKRGLQSGDTTFLTELARRAERGTTMPVIRRDLEVEIRRQIKAYQKKQKMEQRQNKPSLLKRMIGRKKTPTVAQPTAVANTKPIVQRLSTKPKPALTRSVKNESSKSDSPRTQKLLLQNNPRSPQIEQLRRSQRPLIERALEKQPTSATQNKNPKLLLQNNPLTPQAELIRKRMNLLKTDKGRIKYLEYVLKHSNSMPTPLTAELRSQLQRLQNVQESRKTKSLQNMAKGRELAKNRRVKIRTRYLDMLNKNQSYSRMNVDQKVDYLNSRIIGKTRGNQTVNEIQKEIERLRRAQRKEEAKNVQTRGETVTSLINQANGSKNIEVRRKLIRSVKAKLKKENKSIPAELMMIERYGQLSPSGIQKARDYSTALARNDVVGVANALKGASFGPDEAEKFAKQLKQENSFQEAKFWLALGNSKRAEQVAQREEAKGGRKNILKSMNIRKKLKN